jgi:hypothetical protein
MQTIAISLPPPANASNGYVAGCQNRSTKYAFKLFGIGHWWIRPRGLHTWRAIRHCEVSDLGANRNRPQLPSSFRRLNAILLEQRLFASNILRS